MSLPFSPEPEDVRHMVHVFGDSLAGAVAAKDPASAEQVWGQLETTTAEDWQMLFARTYTNKRGTA